jgi:hypothetical protein
VADPPTAFLEHAKIIGIGNKIHVVWVPTLDINGKTKYFDLEIDLTVNDKGKIGDTAAVIVVKFPTFLTNEFIPGTYSGLQGDTCTLALSVAAGGRTAVAWICKDGDGKVIFSANWVTGPIAGYPFEPDLTAAHIDQITGAENVTWGIGSHLEGSAYDCAGGGNNSGLVFSAHQVGNVLAINNFARGNRIRCNYSFTLVQ